MNATNKQRKAKFGDGMFSFIGAILLILSLRWLLIEPYVIPSGSMIPSLLIHDHILVNKMAYGIRVPFTSQWLVRFGLPERGEVVVFRSVDDPNTFMIKRVIGLPGDEIHVSASGEVSVNGEPLNQRLLEGFPQSQSPYYDVSEVDIAGSFNEFNVFEEELDGRKHRTMYRREGGLYWIGSTRVVEEGHLFMMGDNRHNSRDSRAWGQLPADNLLGKAMFVWLSCSETLEYVPFLCNPLELRWSRFFHTIQ